MSVQNDANADDVRYSKSLWERIGMSVQNDANDDVKYSKSLWERLLASLNKNQRILCDIGLMVHHKLMQQCIKLQLTIPVLTSKFMEL